MGSLKPEKSTFAKASTTKTQKGWVAGVRYRPRYNAISAVSTAKSAMAPKDRNKIVTTNSQTHFVGRLSGSNCKCSVVIGSSKTQLVSRKIGFTENW